MSKRVLITGASAGFGHSTVKALAEKGHTVYATMRGVAGKNADKANKLEAWAQEGGHQVKVLELDVTDAASIDKAVATAVEEGGIDVLVNNAGVGNWGIDEGFTAEQAQRLFDVNLFGIIRTNRAVLPHMRDKGAGLIIYVSSGLGRIIFPFLAVYTASKFAVEAYAESCSYELGPLGIQSLILQPGAYGTTFLANSMQPTNDMTETYGPTGDNFKAFSAGFEERAKAGGLGDPQEVVDALVEEVERDGERALRRCVGADVKEGVEPINQTCAQVQGHLLAQFGIK